MDKTFYKSSTKKNIPPYRRKTNYTIKLKPISFTLFKQHPKSYVLSILLTFLILIFLFSCERILDIDNDYNSSVVLEIKRHTTFFDRDSTDRWAGYFWMGRNNYDIDNTTRTLYLYNSYPSTPYSLISTVSRFTDGDGIGGASKLAYFHSSLPTKTPLNSIPIITEPESLFIANLADEIVTFTFRDSSITLAPSSNWIWIDSMYVQTEVGKTFAVDSFKFINHGLLNIKL